jgi:hypothetical protein
VSDPSHRQHCSPPVESLAEAKLNCAVDAQAPRFLREAFGSAGAQARCWGVGLCLMLHRLWLPKQTHCLHYVTRRKPRGLWGERADATPSNLTTVMSMPSRTEVRLTPNMNLLDYTLLPPAQQAALTSLTGTRLEPSVLDAATASPQNVVSMRYCQLMHGSCDLSSAPVSEVSRVSQPLAQGSLAESWSVVRYAQS